MMHTEDRSQLLRWAFRGNAIFSTLSAVVFMAAAEPIASLAKNLPPKQVFFLGPQLAVFAAWMLWLSWRAVIPRWQVWLIIALDILWVVGSFGVLLAPPPALMPGGKLAIGLVADVVALFALLQFLGLRRLRRGGVATESDA